MNKPLFIYLLFIYSLFGANESSIIPTDIFAKSNDFNINKTCKPTCRALTSDYKSKVIAFNPFTGLTSCDITYVNQSIPNGDTSLTANGLVADTINAQCIKDTSNKVPYDSSIASSKGIKIDSINDIKYNPQMTFSRFMVALITLDTEVINFDETAKTGTLVA